MRLIPTALNTIKCSRCYLTEDAPSDKVNMAASTLYFLKRSIYERFLPPDLRNSLFHNIFSVSIYRLLQNAESKIIIDDSVRIESERPYVKALEDYMNYDRPIPLADYPPIINFSINVLNIPFTEKTYAVTDLDVSCIEVQKQNSLFFKYPQIRSSIFKEITAEALYNEFITFSIFPQVRDFSFEITRFIKVVRFFERHLELILANILIKEGKTLNEFKETLRDVPVYDFSHLAHYYSPTLFDPQDIDSDEIKRIKASYASQIELMSLICRKLDADFAMELKQINNKWAPTIRFFITFLDYLTWNSNSAPFWM